MKQKWIKVVLRKEIDKWLTSIEDLEVRRIAGENTIVTGGAIVNMLMAQPVNDYDVYFRSQESALRVAQYYVSKYLENPSARIKRAMDENKVVVRAEAHEDHVRIIVKSAGVAEAGEPEVLGGEPAADVVAPDGREYQYFEATDGSQAAEYVTEVAQTADRAAQETKGQYRPVFLTTNAITLSDKVQLVMRFCGEPEEIHKNYDFVHCTSYWKSWDDELVCSNEALSSILAKELVYVGSKYPVCSLIRLRKFLAREWRITAGQIVKMAWQVSELDLTKMEVLQDQLTGVDAAYFGELIGALKKEGFGAGKPVDSTYIMELIDRIF